LSTRTTITRISTIGTDIRVVPARIAPKRSPREFIDRFLHLDRSDDRFRIGSRITDVNAALALDPANEDAKELKARLGI
jgi:hypothetical protein